MEKKNISALAVDVQSRCRHRRRQSDKMYDSKVMEGRQFTDRPGEV